MAYTAYLPTQQVVKADYVPTVTIKKLSNSMGLFEAKYSTKINEYR